MPPDDGKRAKASIGLALSLILIRTVLVMLVAWNVLVILGIVYHAVTGGAKGVNGWIAHIALESRPLRAGIAQEQRWVSEAYWKLALLFVLPAILYLVLKWLTPRSATHSSK